MATALYTGFPSFGAGPNLANFQGNTGGRLSFQKCTLCGNSSPVNLDLTYPQMGNPNCYICPSAALGLMPNDTTLNFAQNYYAKPSPAAIQQPLYLPRFDTLPIQSSILTSGPISASPVQPNLWASSQQFNMNQGLAFPVATANIEPNFPTLQYQQQQKLSFLPPQNFTPSFASTSPVPFLGTEMRECLGQLRDAINELRSVETHFEKGADQRLRDVYDAHPGMRMPLHGLGGVSKSEHVGRIKSNIALRRLSAMALEGKGLAPSPSKKAVTIAAVPSSKSRKLDTVSSVSSVHSLSEDESEEASSIASLTTSEEPPPTTEDDDTTALSEVSESAPEESGTEISGAEEKASKISKKSKKKKEGNKKEHKDKKSKKSKKGKKVKKGEKDKKSKKGKKDKKGKGGKKSKSGKKSKKGSKKKK